MFSYLLSKGASYPQASAINNTCLSLGLSARASTESCQRALPRVLTGRQSWPEKLIVEEQVPPSPRTKELLYYGSAIEMWEWAEKEVSQVSLWSTPVPQVAAAKSTSVLYKLN